MSFVAMSFFCVRYALEVLWAQALFFLVHQFDKGFGFVDGGFHFLDQGGDVGLDGSQLVFERGDGLGVEVVFKEQDLVVKAFQDGVDFALLFPLRESRRTSDSVLSKDRSRLLRLHP